MHSVYKGISYEINSEAHMSFMLIYRPTFLKHFTHVIESRVAECSMKSFRDLCVLLLIERK